MPIAGRDLGQNRRFGRFRDLIHTPKKLIAAVVEWLDGGGAEDDSEWTFDRDAGTIHTRPGSAVFYAWLAWREHGLYPAAGGWRQQPLAMLTQFDAIEFIIRLWTKIRRTPDFHWGQLTATERAAAGEFF